MTFLLALCKQLATSNAKNGCDLDRLQLSLTEEGIEVQYSAKEFTF